MFSKKCLGASAAVSGICPFGYLEENRFGEKETQDYLIGYTMGLLFPPGNESEKMISYNNFIEGLGEIENGHRYREVIENWLKTKKKINSAFAKVIQAGILDTRYWMPAKLGMI